MPGRDLAGSVEGGSGQTIESVTANAHAVSPSASERAARKLKPVGVPAIPAMPPPFASPNATRTTPSSPCELPHH